MKSHLRAAVPCFLSAAMLLVLASCARKDVYVINGHIAGNSAAIKDGYAYLTGAGIDVPRDTAVVKDGVFRFSAPEVIPGQRTITFKGLRGNIRIFLEEGTFSVEATDSLLSRAVVKGGETQELFNMVDRRRNEILPDDTFISLSLESRLGATSEERKQEIVRQIKAARDSVKGYTEGLAVSNPASWFTVDYLLNNMSDIPYEKLVEMSSEIMSSHKFDGNEDAETVRAFVRNEGLLLPGKPCPSITMKSSAGKSVDFSEVFSSNDLTMVWFWASWLPSAGRLGGELKDIYSKYHDKGFEVISVSLDKKDADWKGFLSTEHPCGIQVSDVKYWNSAAAKTYNIRYIPQNIFVDKEGRIAGRKIESRDIEAFVSGIIK